METAAKSDIFFVITTIAVVFVSAVLVIALYYLARILRDMSSLSRKAREEGEKILSDASHISSDIRNETGEIVKDVRTFRTTARDRFFTFKDIVDVFFKKIIKKKKK